MTAPQTKLELEGDEREFWMRVYEITLAGWCRATPAVQLVLQCAREAGSAVRFLRERTKSSEKGPYR